MVVAIAGLVVAKLAGKGQLTAAKWKPFLTGDLWRTYVLPGIAGTLTAAALSIVLALILGLLLGVGRLSPNAAIRRPCAVIVEFFRAVPVLIMMIFAYFLFALYDTFPSKYLALAGVVTGLTLYNGAVIAEIVRSGVGSLPRGQQEAASALGLSWGQTMRSILLPQAITSMLPVLVSQLVVALKDTAIGYQITFVEMVRQGTVIGSTYGNYRPGADRDRRVDDQRQLRPVSGSHPTGASPAEFTASNPTVGGCGDQAGWRAECPDRTRRLIGHRNTAQRWSNSTLGGW